MRTETKTRNLYTFDELSEMAKNKAIEKERQYQSENFEHEFVYEDAQQIFQILGFEFTDTKQPFYYSGFSSQGDGACIASARYSFKRESMLELKQYCNDEILFTIAKELSKLQRKTFYTLNANIKHSGYYYHERSMSIDSECEKGTFDHKEFDELVSRLCQWLYKQLESEYDYRTSYNACKEELEDKTEIEYDLDGNVA